jgi:spermidine/putrescine transport system substrate-binding protein
MTRLLAASSLAALATAAPAQDSDLLVLTWSGFEEEPFHGAYAEEHGELPSFTFFGDEEEAFQKLRSGFRADVGHPCPHSVRKWRAAGLIEPWDVSLIPNYETVAEEYREPPLADEEGVWFIPADIGATAIAYNSDEVAEEAVQTLEVFASPDYAGRISLPDNVDDSFALGFLATGISDWTTAGEAELEAAAAWLRTVHPNVRTYWTDGAELAQLMATGEVLVAWAWNETPVTLSAEGRPIAFEREAAEGSSTWGCGYVNLVDGPGSEEKAHDFVDSFLSPDVAQYIVTEWGYGHGNAQAMEGIGAETLAEVGMGPVDAPVLRQLPMDDRLRERMIEEFELIKAGF